MAHWQLEAAGDWNLPTTGIDQRLESAGNWNQPVTGIGRQLESTGDWNLPGTEIGGEISNMIYIVLVGSHSVVQRF